MRFEFPEDSRDPICLVAVTGFIDAQFNHKVITMLGVMNPDRIIQATIGDSVSIGMDEIAQLAMHYVVLFESIDQANTFVLLSGGDTPGQVLDEGIAVGEEFGRAFLVEQLIKHLNLGAFQTNSNLEMLNKTRDFLNKLKG
jgi:hypothetical protein